MMELPPLPRVLLAYCDGRWNFLGVVSDETKSLKEAIKDAACVAPQPCSVIVARLQISERADSEIIQTEAPCKTR